MGIFQCKKHGLSGFLEIEDFICDKIYKGEKVHASELEVITEKVIIKDDNIFETLINKYIISRATKVDRNIQSEYIAYNNDETGLPLLNLHILCSRCLYEYPYKENLTDILKQYRE